VAPASTSRLRGARVDLYVYFEWQAGAIFWADPAHDLTDEIIERLDAN